MDLLRVSRPAFIVVPLKATEKLSLEALGLLVWAAGQERPQIFGLPAVARQLGISEERLSALLQELACQGYARLDVVRRADGKLAGRRWLVCPLGDVPNPDSAKAMPEAPSSETRETPVSVTSPIGHEKAGEEKMTQRAGENAEARENGGFGESPLGSAPTPCHLPQTKPKPFEHAGGSAAPEHVADAVPTSTNTATLAPARSRKRSVRKKNILNNSPLPVEGERGQEVPAGQEGDIGSGTSASLDLGSGTSASLDYDRPDGHACVGTGWSKAAGSAQPRNARYQTKPISEWNAADFVAYMLDAAAAQSKPVLVPKAALGQHMRWLLERARALWGAQGPLAVKELVDLYWSQPAVYGTGYLLREAEWFFSRWRPAVQEKEAW